MTCQPYRAKASHTTRDACPLGIAGAKQRQFLVGVFARLRSEVGSYVQPRWGSPDRRGLRAWDLSQRPAAVQLGMRNLDLNGRLPAADPDHARDVRPDHFAPGIRGLQGDGGTATWHRRLAQAAGSVPHSRNGARGNAIRQPHRPAIRRSGALDRLDQSGGGIGSLPPDSLGGFRANRTRSSVMPGGRGIVMFGRCPKVGIPARPSPSASRALVRSPLIFHFIQGHLDINKVLASRFWHLVRWWWGEQRRASGDRRVYQTSPHSDARLFRSGVEHVQRHLVDDATPSPLTPPAGAYGYRASVLNSFFGAGHRRRSSGSHRTKPFVRSHSTTLSGRSMRSAATFSTPISPAFSFRAAFSLSRATPSAQR